MESTHTVSSYMIQRLYECGVNHIFGVPGDYVLGFYNQLLHSNRLKKSALVMNLQQMLMLVLRDLEHFVLPTA
jgi:TPP-dependent 2-oxoacid decarboxylase